MKTTERNDLGFKRELHYRNNYAFGANDYRIQQVRNQNFIVPWQIVENEKKEVLVV